MIEVKLTYLPSDKQIHQRENNRTFIFAGWIERTDGQLFIMSQPVDNSLIFRSSSCDKTIDDDNHFY